jgi:hypothetical protein
MENVVFKPYKDEHKGKRVFLIANGPSLANTNLSLLENETTIAMNRISLIYDNHPTWRPTYYLFSSTNVKNDVWGGAWTQSVIDAVNEGKTTSFIASQFRQYIDSKDKYPQIQWFDSITETKPQPNGDISENCFSTDVVNRIDKSGTSMNLALQLVYYMGFSEVVIIGADLGWTKDLGSNSDPNHFDKLYTASVGNPNKVNYQMRNIHSLAYNNLMKKDYRIRVYNASLKTVLDVYPIIDYEKYILEDKIIHQKDRLQEAKTFWNRPPQFFSGVW